MENIGDRKIDFKNSNKITVLSFAMSIVIVFLHMDPSQYFKLITTDNFLDKVSLTLNNQLSSMAVVATSFFFFIAAFLLYFNLSKEGFKHKIINRIYSLFIPYILWNLIGFILIQHTFRNGWLDILNNFMLANYDGPLWFLKALLVLLAFSFIIQKIFTNKLIANIFVCITFLFCYLLNSYFSTVEQSTLVIILNRFVSNIPIYILGANIGYNYFEYFSEDKYNKRYIRVFSFILFIIVSVNVKYSCPPLFIKILKSLRPVMLWCMFDKSLFDFKIKWWQQKSFFIYACHAIASFFIVTFALKHNFSAIRVSASMVLLTRSGVTLVLVVCILLLSQLLCRYFPRVYKILTGGRMDRK